MVYKKYIKRDGNIYGPYIYHSKKVGGKVISEYIGKPEDKNKKSKNYYLLFFIITLLFLAVIFAGVQFIPHESFSSFTDSKTFSGVSDSVKLLPQEKMKDFGNVIAKTSGSVFLSAKNSILKIIGFATEGEESSENDDSQGDDSSSESENSDSNDKQDKQEDKQEEKEQKQEEKQEEKQNEEQPPAEETPEEIPAEEPEVEENETEETEPEETPIINETEIPTEELNETQTEINETISNETEVNTTIPVINETQTEINETIVSNITEVNETLSNETISNETLSNITALQTNETLKQFKAVIGKPVKWIKTITINSSDDSLVQLPKDAINITIKTGSEITEALAQVDEYETLVKSIDKQELISGITGFVSQDIKNNKGVFERFLIWFKSLSLTGKAISEEEIANGISETSDSKIVDVSSAISGNETQEIAIEYYTEAPQAIEIEKSNGKEITISTEDELNYTEILAYSLVNESFGVTDTNTIKLYWENENYSTVSFDSYDLDNNGILDYIEWIIPHLSNQTYKLVINTGANVTYTNASFEKDFNYLPVNNLSVPYSSLVAYWSFDRDNSSSSFDLAGSNDGVVSEVVFNSTCGLYDDGGCFDGLDDYIDIPASEPLILGKTVTISVWFKRNGTTANQALLTSNNYYQTGYNGNWLFRVTSGTALAFASYDEKANEEYKAFTFTVDNGVWNHAVISIDGSVGTVYLNGVASVSGTMTHTKALVDAGTSGLRIGDDKAWSNVNFNGSIDEVMIFNTSLSEAQVQNLYNNQSARFKKQGDIEYKQMNFGSALNSVNLTASYERKQSTNISAKLGYWQVSQGYNNTDMNLSEKGLRAYWHLDEASGNVIDAVKGENNGTVNGTIQNFAGVYGTAYKFNGSSDYAELAVTPTFAEDQYGTIVAWVKDDFSGDFDNIFAKGGDDANVFLLRIEDTNKLRIWAGGASGSSLTDDTITTGVWTHVAVVSNSSNYTMYINGREVVASTGTNNGAWFGDCSPSNPTYRIGAGEWSDVLNQPFNGSIDDVMIFNRSLSADEVKELYMKGRANWVYTPEQNLTTLNASDFKSQNLFALALGTTNAYPIFTLQSDSNKFYTPFLLKDAKIDFNDVIDLTAPSINFTNPTLPNRTQTTNTSIVINVSIADTNRIVNITYNWNGTNFTMYDNSLVLMMNFDNLSAIGESASVVKDLSLYGNNGSVSGAVVNWTNCKYGNCYTFDGSDDYIDLGDSDSLNITGAITLSAWVYLHTFPIHSQIINKGDWNDAYGLIVFNTAKAGINLEGLTTTLVSSTSVLSANTWYHLTGTYDGSTLSLYVNGILDNSSPTSGTIANNGNPVWVGREQNSGGRWTPDGSIDEVRIWNRSLSASEIYQQYVSNLAKFNSTNWNLLVANQSTNASTGLGTGNYTYQAFAKDNAGNLNYTEVRKMEVTASVLYPQINFTNPTLPNRTQTANTSIVINVSIVEQTNKIDSIIYNWNGTNFTIYNDSLVLMYNFDNLSALGENASDVKDLSKWGGNGSVVGARWDSNGKYGGTYTFDGENEYAIQTPIIFNSDQDPLTYAVWIRLNGTSQCSIYGEFNDNDGATRNWFVISAGNTIIFDQFPSDGSGNTQATTSSLVGSWHYVSLTRKNDNVSFYVDGVLIDSPSNAETYNGGAITVAGIGARYLSSAWSSAKCNGSVDGLRIWNRTLSASEIYQQYVSNLAKYNSTNWNLLVANQSTNATTGLGTGNYTYQAMASNVLNNWNYTEVRKMEVTTADTSGPVCTLISRIPANITDNSTGVLEVVMNCTDSSGVNINKTGINYNKFFTTRTVDAFILAAGIPNYWSNRYPNNSLGVIGALTPPYKVWRSLGRNRGFWYENLTILKDCQGVSPCYNVLNDTFSYAIEDGQYGHFSILDEGENNISVVINYTHPIIGIAAYRQSVYLSYEGMVSESKKNYTIKLNYPVLMKRFDAEAYRNTSNYTMTSYRNFGVVGTPTRTLRAFYCNSSYDIAGGIKVINSPNCALINSLTKTQIENRIYTDRNSSYSKGTYAITNGKFGGITATAEFYIEYESPEPNSAAKYYQLRYANQSTITDIGFNDTDVVWTSTNGGAAWTQAYWTPDVFTTSVRQTNDEFDFGYYTEDNLGNAGYNFTFIQDDISLVNHPISFPLILEYNSTGYREDLDLNETHHGIMNIKIGIAADPDSVGNVTHNVTLRNIDGTYNYSINESFKSANDADMWIEFNTSLVVDGSYRMMIKASSGDDTSDFKNRTTDRNFTIDNTKPNITLNTPSNLTITNETWFNFTANITDDSGIKNATLYIYNQTGLYNTTVMTFAAGVLSRVVGIQVLLVEGIYTWFYQAFDWVGNLGTSDANSANFSISIDKTSPGIVILYPVNATTYAENITEINYTYSEPNNDSCWWSNDSGATWNSTKVTARTNFTGFNSTYGQNNWTIYCNDSVGNLNSSIVTFTISSGPTGPGYTTCGELNVTAIKYTLTQDVASDKGCFNVSVEDVILDCAGYTIIYGNVSVGIGVQTNASNLTIKNCNITKGNRTSGTNTSLDNNYGVYINTAHNATIFNNTISTFGSDNNNGIYITGAGGDNNITQNRIMADGYGATQYGIYVLGQGPNNTLIQDNIIRTNNSLATGDDNSGIYLEKVANNQIINNTIHADGRDNGNYGIYLSTSSSNTITQNRVWTNGSSVNHGIYLEISSDYNNLTNNQIVTNGSNQNYGIYAAINSNNTILNNTIYTDGKDQQNHGIELSNIRNFFVHNNTIFTSGTYGSSGIHLSANANSNRVDKNIITAGGITGDGIRIYSTASWNNITYNNITSASAYGIYFDANGVDLYPNNTILTGNIFGEVASEQVYLEDYVEDNFFINQSITNMTVINSTGLTWGNDVYGKITFIYSINFTRNDTDAIIKILNNSASVFMNNTYRTVNVTSNITLYGLRGNYTSPIILKDGIRCGSACTNFTSLNAGTVVFNVSSWSNYSIGESTPPNITLNTPANMTITNETWFNFTANITDDTGIKNATLFIYNQTGLYNTTTMEFVAGVLTRMVGIQVLLVEGIYTWFYQAFDWVGNLGTSDTNSANFSISIDKTSPGIVILYPVNATTYTNNITEINYTYSEPNNDSCWWSNDSGATWNSTKVSARTNFTGFNSTYGQNNWTVYCNDSVGNQNSSSVTFTITLSDVVYPLVNITYPLNNTLFNTTSIVINYTVVETNIGSCWYTNDSGTTNNSMTCGTNLTTLTWVQGINNITIYANDTSGNTNSSIVSFFVDTLSPYVNFTNPMLINASTQNFNSIYVNVSANDTASNISTFIDLDNSLVSWWRMDDVSGTKVVDYAGGRNNGTAVGGASQTDAGKMGKAMVFNGSSDYISVASSDSLNSMNTKIFTFSAWVKPIDAGSNQIAHYNTERQFLYSYSQANKFSAYTGSWLFSTNTFSTDTWHHFVIIANNSNTIMYVDGNKEDIDSISSTSTATLYLGSYNGASDFFNGSIDDVMIFNRSLSASEVQALYANTSSKYLEQNFTSLSDGTHTFKAYVQDSAGNVNVTELKSVSVDTLKPGINFTLPTQLNNTKTKLTSTEVNLSIQENKLSSLIYNWNGTNFTMYNDSLVLMMNFDNVSALGENDTHIKDLSLYGNNGTITGALWNSSGRYGGAYSFDGEDDYINAGNSSNYKFGTGDFAVSFWMKANTWDNYATVISNGIYSSGWSGFLFTEESGGGGCVDHAIRFEASGTTCGSLITVGNWYHIVGVRSSGVIQVYVNGVGGTSGGGRTNSVDTNNSLYIGKDFDPAYPRPFNGSIDEVRIWNRSLSASEVYEQYVSNLQKYNSTQWYLYVNQSYNASTGFGTGNYTYQGFASDTAGNLNMTEIRDLYVDVDSPNVTLNTPANLTITNETWFNFTANITDVGLGIKNATLYIYNETGLYNSTVMEFVNGVFSRMVGIQVLLVEGIYTWFYQAFDWVGNLGTSDANSANFTITVDRSNPIVNITYPINTTTYAENITEINYTYSETNAGSCWWSNDSGATWNSTKVNARTNFTSITSIEGNNNWTVYCNDSAGNQNFSSITFNTDSLAPLVTSLTESPTDPATYSSSSLGTYGFNISVNDASSLITAKLEFNGINYTASNKSNVYNVTLPINLGVDVYNYTWYVNDSLGNKNDSQNGSYTVNISDAPLNILLNGVANNLTLTYPAQVNISISANKTNLSINVNGTSFTPGVNYTLGVGYWKVNVTSLGSQNYSFNESIWYITINQAANNLTALLNGNNANLSINYSQQLNASFNGTNFTTLLIKVNGTQINYGINYTWGVGTWELNYSVSETQNYTGFHDLLKLEVNKTSSEINLTLNNTKGNITINQNTAINLNCSLISGDNGERILLYNNGTLINNKTSLVGNLTNFTNDYMHNITCVYEATQNYTASSEILWVNVTSADLIPPNVTIHIPLNATTYTTSSMEINISLSENGTCEYSLDSGTSNNSLTKDNYETGFTKTLTGLSNGNYLLNAYCNDSVGNKNYTESSNFTINVPATTTAKVSASSGGGSGGVVKRASDISVTQESLEVVAVKGTEEVRVISVKNNQNRALVFSISIIGEDLKDVVELPSVVSLAAGESKDIAIKINSPEKGLLAGKIVMTSGEVVYETPVIINVKSENFLFDTSISTFEESKQLKKGEPLKVQIDLSQVGPEEKVDVSAKYVIKDLEGNKYLEESETFYVFKEKTYVKEFKTSELPKGRYMIGLEIVYPGAFATSSTQFEIIGNNLNWWQRFLEFIKNLF